MVKKIIKRSVSSKILEYSEQYPVVTITGPRQSGKTTLSKMLFPGKKYVSLESPNERLLAVEDPVGFLKKYPDGAVLDEVQRAPELFSYIQTIVDENDKEGMFILTGSQQFGLMENISQSLAGRTALITLLPLSLQEAYGLDLENTDIDSVLWTGFYPGIFDKNRNPNEMMQFYTSTYLERDVRRIINVRDLVTFDRFLRLCAGRTGQVLNKNSLAKDCGIDHKTVETWLSVLETSYIIRRLRPYYSNIRKRQTKTAKLYFLDTGLACSLLGVQNQRHLISHPLKGALFETLVVSEAWKALFNGGKPDNLYYFRDDKKHEVDLICDNGISQIAFEIKSSQTVKSGLFKGLNYYKKATSLVKKCILIYGGYEKYHHHDVEVIGWRDMPTINFEHEDTDI